MPEAGRSGCARMILQQVSTPWPLAGVKAQAGKYQVLEALISSAAAEGRAWKEVAVAQLGRLEVVRGSWGHAKRIAQATLNIIRASASWNERLAKEQLPEQTACRKMMWSRGGDGDGHGFVECWPHPRPRCLRLH